MIEYFQMFRQTLHLLFSRWAWGDRGGPYSHLTTSSMWDGDQSDYQPSTHLLQSHLYRMNPPITARFIHLKDGNSYACQHVGVSDPLRGPTPKALMFFGPCIIVITEE